MLKNIAICGGILASVLVGALAVNFALESTRGYGFVNPL